MKAIMLMKSDTKPYRQWFLLLSFSQLVTSSHNAQCQVQQIPQARKSGKLRAFLNSQITQRGREGNLDEACSIFDTMPFRDVVSWTAMLTAYADNGEISKAREMFEQMPRRNAASWNAMISAYARDPKFLLESYELFSAMPKKNSVSYAAMITGFARGGMLLQAEKVYRRMPPGLREPIGSNALINAYLRVGEIEKADRVFQGMFFRDVFTWSSMVDGYCKNGMVLEARQAFEAMPVKNVISWTAMIQGHAKLGDLEESLCLFSQMRKENMNPNSTTLSIMLDACTKFGRIRGGTQIHGLAIVMGFEHDIFLDNTLIFMYFRADNIDDARKVFDYMSRRDVVSWNSLITGYVEQDKIEEAHALFDSMPHKDVVSWTSMVTGFSRRGWTEESISLFESMPEKDDFGWTSIVSGLVHNGKHEIACQWFNKMAREGIKLNPLVLSSILRALASLAILKEGMQIHACVVKTALDSDIFILSSLISMYSKCGNLREACWIFSSIRNSNIVCINSMITAFAEHGLAREAFDLFRRMKGDGHMPNEITFLAILAACSRSGLVEEGNHFFDSMKSVYGIDPGPDHYTCMVDLLGRAGLLKEALSLINSIPYGPNSAAWGAMLGATAQHSNTDLAKLAFHKLFELEPENPTPYAVLSKIYGADGLNEDEDASRKEEYGRGVQKNPGCSWVAINGIEINAPS
ncbi:pentatricopeptide repeat-containing protein At1g53600, mitochondrial-like [Phalaenopsis equestris]|uniref:pentatricopeptide repeat-containing protein At1g53600, mitochondrial-like n=1 Tax=Phalaenopsis equestris TaxID=78828 RepID=UPI0009E51EF8|nr:pentatricopeptide repeat-containing protein At1g53600, mitochondrial-like [Phalaenopsis equestris]